MFWQGVLVAFIVIDCILALALHGQVYQRNFWATLVGAAITLWILYMGGFFS